MVRPHGTVYAREKFVYLAGPILGCTKGEANDWRGDADALLYPNGIVGISPLRCEPLIGDRYTTEYSDPRFGTAKAISAKNLYDVENCDMGLVYLPKPADGCYPSVGTIMELGALRAAHKQTVVWTDDPFMMKHPVVLGWSDWQLPTLEAACEVLIGILGGYTGGKNV